MESEAILDGELGEEIATRRRSHSFSDDYSVQKTNDDATHCKAAAVQLGYYKDEFLNRFITEDVIRRDPEINIGYWARVASISTAVDRFVLRHQGKCQIISLGCGFDTLYWRQKAAGKHVQKFVEVDFSSVTARKIKHIMKPGQPNLVEYFTEKPKDRQHADLHAGDYHLVGADIRQWNELETKLEACGIDANLPTLFLAECVFPYISVDATDKLLKELAEMFQCAVFLNYEQINVTDRFGKIMEENLEHRNVQLPGFAACVNEDTHIERFVRNGWKEVKVFDMNEVYNSVLNGETTRIEKIEKLDEMLLVRQLLLHYALVMAINDRRPTASAEEGNGHAAAGSLNLFASSAPSSQTPV
ncbi:hypothetical protein WR25_11304 [Diploscapter pachys]|uniref:Leucine carboxyl methyltransferase 1 n=1 Tax=Diploscapter pachys TaxID=2018661 RepID=A0A2A2K8P1_9BILA|nr:hypothetical protein WR25_11304 [Diploscapter pachys]